MHYATIPLAALATFAGVYWLAPGPAAREAQPAPVAEAAAPPVAVDRASLVPAAVKRAKTQRRRRPAAHSSRSVATTARALRPALRTSRVSVYFSGCNEVRAAGLAPLYEGQPGYRPELDGDDDGIACEPHRGRRRW